MTCKAGMTTRNILSRHGVQKNGVHFGDVDGPEFNIADSSRLAEAWRLIAEVTAGEQLVYEVVLKPEVRSHSGVQQNLFLSIPFRLFLCTENPSLYNLKLQDLVLKFV